MTRRRVRALRMNLAPHRAALALAAGRAVPDVFRGGPGSPLRLVDIAAPHRRPGWVRVRPLLAGICASDRKMLHLTSFGPTLVALYGVPSGLVPGHEVVGIVTEADRGTRVREGDRVVLEPTLACADKGYRECERCRGGDDHLCEHIADRGVTARGQGFGHHAMYGGGWAEELVAPERRAYVVPRHVDDRAAVLTEPFAIAVHAVARAGLRRGARVLVFGPGSIGLAVVHAVRCLRPDAEIVVVGLHPFSDELATSAGADIVLHGNGPQLVTSAGEHLATTVRGGRASGPLLEDGFDVVFDTVANAQTLDDSFRTTRPRGTVVVVGTSARQSVDWTLVWARELSVRGTVYYGTEDVLAGATVAEGRRRAMAIALDIVGSRDVAPLVTHVFPLEEPVAALRAADAGPNAAALKVAFAP